MRFNMDGQEVLVKRLEFEGGGGHILQLRVACKGPKNKVPAVFQKITSALRKNNDGVMDNGQPDDKGYVEVRVLQGLELPAVLSVMAHNVSVIQVD